jgi:hypothetical protein
MFAVQFIRGSRPQHEHADDGDLDWETETETIHTSWSAADDAAQDLEASFDGARTYRVVELRAHVPDLSKWGHMRKTGPVNETARAAAWEDEYAADRETA